MTDFLLFIDRYRVHQSPDKPNPNVPSRAEVMSHLKAKSATSLISDKRKREDEEPQCVEQKSEKIERTKRR